MPLAASGSTPASGAPRVRKSQLRRRRRIAPPSSRAGSRCSVRAFGSPPDPCLSSEAGVSPSYVAVLGHASPAITLSTYAHAFASAEHDERTRKRMEVAFGELLEV